MKYIFIIMLISGVLNTVAQNNVDLIISVVEKNNTTLAYLEKKVKAEQIDHRTGIAPGNPELGFHYLWGSPDQSGKRNDFSISQSFDFPTVYSHQRNISDARVEQAKLQLEDFRIRLHLETRKLCYELIYLNIQQEELGFRQVHATRLAEAYQRMIRAGETNRIEFNKASLNKINAEQAFKRIATYKEGVLIKLQALNGGNALNLRDQEYPLSANFDHFSSWLDNVTLKNPHLQFLKQDIDILEKEEKLTRAMRLPKFNAGYMSEKTSGEGFQGVTIGMTVPLWENKNRQKLARAQSEAGVKRSEDAHIQFLHHIKNSFETAKRLKHISDLMSKGLENYNNAELLEKAFSTGEISLITYLMELSYFYSSVDKALEAEYEYMNAQAELEVYGL